MQCMTKKLNARHAFRMLVSLVRTVQSCLGIPIACANTVNKEKSAHKRPRYASSIAACSVRTDTAYPERGSTLKVHPCSEALLWKLKPVLSGTTASACEGWPTMRKGIDYTSACAHVCMGAQLLKSPEGCVYHGMEGVTWC